MANLKIFHNIKGSLTTREWWKGIFGNIMSTVIGIALTIGIGAMVQYHNDKRLARNMMFNVVNATESNGEVVEKHDKMFQEHIRCIDSLVAIYNRNNGNIDNVPIDTLKKYINGFTSYYYCTHMEPEIYMNNSQTLHMFGNADVYKNFQEFVQFDKMTFEEIDELISEWRKCAAAIYSKEVIDNEESHAKIKQLIESNMLTDYCFKVRISILHARVNAYKTFTKMLLKSMHATKEEYDDYLKNNDDENNDSIEIHDHQNF